jgi:hypothetical protein
MFGPSVKDKEEKLPEHPNQIAGTTGPVFPYPYDTGWINIK